MTVQPHLPYPKPASNASLPQTFVTLYVQYHTSREPELYTLEEFSSPANPELFECIMRAEGGGHPEERDKEFVYRKVSPSQFSVYAYTYSGKDGYLDYDIEWVEEMIRKAENP